MKKGRLIGQGRTAEIFALEDNKVLKLFRADMAHKSVEKEFTLGRTITQLGVPAPAIYGKVTVEGRQGIIYEHVTGKTMLDYISARPMAAGVEAKRLASIHHEIHRHTIVGLPKQKEVLAESIRRAVILSARERRIILDRLYALPQGNQLCHGDLHPDNIMVSAQSAVVLDWMNATVGSPAADVARTILLLRDASPPPGTALWMIGLFRFLRKHFYASYIREYYRISDLTQAQIEPWLLPVAAARLTETLPQIEMKLLQQIVRRHLKKCPDCDSSI